MGRQQMSSRKRYHDEDPREEARKAIEMAIFQLGDKVRPARAHAPLTLCSTRR